MFTQLDGISLGIRGGELASARAGAGDEAAGDRIIPVVEPAGLDGGDGGLEFFIGDAGETKISPWNL